MPADSEDYIYRYKYMPFSDGALAVIANGTMKFTNPLDFNDPFDCLPNMDVDSQLQRIKSDQGVRKQIGAKSGADYIRKKRVFKKRLETSINDGSYQKHAAAKVGVCSMSRSPLNLLMWAHYADRHSGFVVEFKIPIKFIGISPSDGDKKLLEYQRSNLLPYKVNYSRKRPELKLTETSYEFLENHLLTKSTDWEYEQEERAINIMS